MFEKTFELPKGDSQKSAITATEELIDPKNISMKTRLVDPNSVTALEVIMFDTASDVPSNKQVLTVEALRREGWTLDEAGAWISDKKWEMRDEQYILVDQTDSEAQKALALVEVASDAGGRTLQINYLKLLLKQLGLDDKHITEDYEPGPSDYLFFWTNVKKINNVSWNGKGRIEFLQGLIGSMFLQSETAAAQMAKIASG
jgi:hypothetical protein